LTVGFQPVKRFEVAHKKGRKSKSLPQIADSTKATGALVH
jgi:hypothetical protein